VDRALPYIQIGSVLCGNGKGFEGVAVWQSLMGSCTSSSQSRVKDQLRGLLAVYFLYFCFGLVVNYTAMRNEYSNIILCIS